MIRSEPPGIIILAGPNGAGKSTAGLPLIRDTLGTGEFVNADVIARGLSAFEPDKVAVSAGRIMIERLKDLASRRQTFAFETTLASRTFAPWIADLMPAGYVFHLVFLWLPSPEMAIRRVRNRVRLGGHDVPEEVIRRRYAAGLGNFFRLYRPLATEWHMYDNSVDAPRLIAEGRGMTTTRIADADIWDALTERFEGNPEGTPEDR